MSAHHPLTPPDELLEHWCAVGKLGNWQNALALAYRAGAALAQQHVSQPYKLPEPVAPTDEELDRFADEVWSGSPRRYARAVLARWGTPAIQPEPVAPTGSALEDLFRRALEALDD
jgi:hypothetical protein